MASKRKYWRLIGDALIGFLAISFGTALIAALVIGGIISYLRGET